MRCILSCILLVMGLNSSAQSKKPIEKATSSPKLVIGLVIDQMRYDFLFRYQNRYKNGGFKRLLNEGFNCEQTHINYIPTVTGAGHASIYTGSIPAIHGIASNDWIETGKIKATYCTQDDETNCTGCETKAGKQSPKNLYTTTIGDELRLATNFKSQVVGISLKDRASILPAGHSANAVFWMDDSLGNFISSSYYMNQLPNWLIQFNEEQLAKNYLQKEWNNIYAIETYTQSTKDDNRYEYKSKTDINTSFPHITSKYKKYADIKRTPFGNNIMLDLAKEAIVQMQLGKNTVTDMLCISLSSTDYIGHAYGPNSIEIEDTYLRLDAEIESFLNFLDLQIGKGNYTLFLSADHGAAHNPNFLNDNKIPGGFFVTSEFKKEFNTNFGSNAILEISDNEVWLNDSVLQTNPNAIDQVITALKKRNEIQYVVKTNELNTSTMPKLFKELISNSYVPNRSGQIYYILKAGFIDGYQKTGTTHGAWNPYDTHIPLVWFGNGIKKGKSFVQYEMSDIAATIAALLHIQEPNGCIGKPIVEVMK